LVEHATENRSVGGSIPPLGTIIYNKINNVELDNLFCELCATRGVTLGVTVAIWLHHRSVVIHPRHRRSVSVDRTLFPSVRPRQHDFGRERKDYLGVGLKEPGLVGMFVPIRPAHAHWVVVRDK
jgi:hypothetical protein